MTGPAGGVPDRPPHGYNVSANTVAVELADGTWKASFPAMGIEALADTRQEAVRKVALDLAATMRASEHARERMKEITAAARATDNEHGA